MKDVEEIAGNIVPDIPLVKPILNLVLGVLRVALTDLLFMAFFASQELMDHSHIEMMNMKAVYSTGSITFAVFASKIVMNALLITLVYFFSSYCVSVYEGHCVSVIAIYFICAYEFLFNVLAAMAEILNLDNKKLVNQ